MKAAFRALEYRKHLKQRFEVLGRLIAAAISFAGCGLGIATAGATKAPLPNPKAYVSPFIVNITVEERAEPLRALQQISSAHGASCSTPFKKVKELVRIECYGPSEEAAKESADRVWEAMKKADEERMAAELAVLGDKPGQDAPEAVRLVDLQKRLQAAQNHYIIHQVPSLTRTKMNAEQVVPPNGPRHSNLIPFSIQSPP